MKIKLWADLVDWPLEASVSGDVITINGEDIDLSGIPEGYRLPGSAVGNKFFVETEFVERINGELNFTIRLPVHWDTVEEYRNPSKPIFISVKKGVVNFPDTTPPEPVEIPEIVLEDIELVEIEPIDDEVSKHG